MFMHHNDFRSLWTFAYIIVNFFLFNGSLNSHNNLRAVKTLRPFVFGFELAFSPLDDTGTVCLHSLH